MPWKSKRVRVILEAAYALAGADLVADALTRSAAAVDPSKRMAVNVN